MNQVIVHPSWKKIFETYLHSDKGKELKDKVTQAYMTEKVFPPPKYLFNAFNETPLEDVSVVIIGQDPYHGEGQAHGFSFSVPDGISPPPSLLNIYKEIEADIGSVAEENGNLTQWAQQGVLLLNAILTVRARQAASHRDIGWEDFTNYIIQTISEAREDCVFLLWGAFAQQKESLIDGNRHCILKAVHPSPLSAANGFFGCKHFSKANEYLTQHGKNPIVW